MDNESKESLIRDLNNIVTKLMCNHGVKHKSIKDEIFKTIKDKSSELPKLQVLYNNTYGGYGYSKDFEDFKANNLDDTELEEYDVCEYRVAVVKLVERYGAYCKERYPLIVKKINIYNQYCLGDVFKNAELCKFYISEIKRFDKYIDEINTCDCFGDLEYTSKYISYDFFKKKIYINYTKESLFPILHNEKIKFENNLTNSTLLNEEKVGNEMLELINNELDGKHKDLFSKEDKDTFADAIVKYGESSIEIWKHQPYYNVAAMEFLVKYPDVLPNNFEKCSDIEMGLLFANGKYCKLVVGEAPRLLNWCISEYDGLERIAVKP